MKRCPKCEDYKPEYEFSKDSARKNGLQVYCKKCSYVLTLKRTRTKSGLIKQIYNTQRNSSRARNHKMPNYTEEQLSVWLLTQSLFHELYENWKNSGYLKTLRPSCDRTDDYKGYCLSRLQLMTWQENCDKYMKNRITGVNNKQSKPIFQYTKDGIFVKEFYSAAQASRETGVSGCAISSCCNKRKRYLTAGGFVWKFI